MSLDGDGAADLLKSFGLSPYEHKLLKVADMLHISEKHFCRLFRKQYGIPPQEFLINIRLQKAKQLLKTTDLRVKEVAGSVGYSSQLVFSEIFKKRFGQSPTEYRKKITLSFKLKVIFLFYSKFSS